MYRTIAIITFISLTVTTRAQERIHEAGIGLYGFNQFSLVYRVGSPTLLWRASILTASAGEQENYLFQNGQRQINRGVALAGGVEKRKEVAPQFQFRYGFDLSFSIDYSKYESYTADMAFAQGWRTQTFRPGINGVVGLNYVIKEKFVVGAEVMPGFSYQFGSSKTRSAGQTEVIERDIRGFHASISSTSALLSLAYRF